MNALAKIDQAQRLLPAVDVLEIRASIRAFLWWEYQYADLADAVDPLQHYAEQSGLVDHIGQDAVQKIIAAPFARFQAMSDAMAAAEAEVPDDFIPDAVIAWELADPRDRWKWTGDAPPLAPADDPPPKPYRTPQVTVDAFWYVVRTADETYLARWLSERPQDAPYLKKLWESKCLTLAA